MWAHTDQLLCERGVGPRSWLRRCPARHVRPPCLHSHAPWVNTRTSDPAVPGGLRSPVCLLFCSWCFWGHVREGTVAWRRQGASPPPFLPGAPDLHRETPCEQRLLRTRSTRRQLRSRDLQPWAGASGSPAAGLCGSASGRTPGALAIPRLQLFKDRSPSIGEPAICTHTLFTETDHPQLLLANNEGYAKVHLLTSVGPKKGVGRGTSRLRGRACPFSGCGQGGVADTEKLNCHAVWPASFRPQSYSFCNV